MATGVKISQLPEHVGALTNVTIPVISEGANMKFDASKLVQVEADGKISPSLIPEGVGGGGAGTGNYTESVYGS